MSAATATYGQAFQLGVREEMERDESIFVMGTDLFDRGGHWGQVTGLGEAFGQERVRDTPISEAAMVAAGVGAALNGMRPIVDMNFMDFVLGAMDELVNQAAKIRYMWRVPVPVVVRGTAGVAFGGPQHNNSLEAYFAHTPGLVVVMPSTPADAKGLIKSALRGADPVVFLMHKVLNGRRGEVGGIEDLVPFGKAQRVRRGSTVTAVGYGVTVEHCLAAADALVEDGIELDVIDLRTLYPLDLELILESVRETHHLVVVDEAPGFASIASEIAASVQERAFDHLDAPIARVTGAHAPIPHSPPLLEAVIPDAAAVTRAVRELLR
jgi:acetoin:2,6-dichlorophenolindophenol oxidoreductase subunit beta